MKPNFSITGKTVVVTGASGVLCSEMSRELAELGARLALCNRNREKGEALASEIRAAGGEAEYFRVDVLDKSSLEQAEEEILKRFGTVDVLINGAGGNRKDATTSPELSFFDIPQDALQAVFNLNFIGAVLASQVFGRPMAKAGKGCILNISSMASITPLTNVLGYGAAKAALNNFTQWLAVHMNQNYSPLIRVNAIAPGFLLTEQNRFLLKKEDGTPTERSAKILAGTPMGRYGEPRELVGAAVWLMSDAASFVTGDVIPIDGGFAAYSGV